jgi:D-aminopeptidase
VVAETWDGWLSDIGAFALTEDDVRAALDRASGGTVAEGCVGGGTGMICHEFKGGIGTSSRMVDTGHGRYTLGVLVQANYGRRADLRVDGRPVGRLIGKDRVPSPWDQAPSGGSIIVIVATDAPLLPIQCRRLVKRVTVGLGRVGGYGHDSSGDIFLAFSTGNHLPSKPTGTWALQALAMDQIDGLFHAVADATEESILNALCAAETTTGQKGRVAHAIPLDDLAAVIAG